ncbi:MAG: TnpV protein [Lachnospiraceae bacterium]|nr:TnpV protein [Lachnospiraceae bacterium]
MLTGYEETSITRYGMMHKEYMEANHPELVKVLDNECRLMPHLKMVEDEAEQMHKKIMERKEREAIATGEITPELRNEQPLEWAARMTRMEQETISQVAREFVLTDVPVRVERDPSMRLKSMMIVEDIELK